MRAPAAVLRSLALGAFLALAGSASASAASYSLSTTLPDGQGRGNVKVCIGEGCAAAGTPGFLSNRAQLNYDAEPTDVIEIFDRNSPGEAQRAIAAEANNKTFAVRNAFTAGPHPAESTEERQFVDLVNQARTGAGLQPVTPYSRLYDAADRHNAWMLRTNTQAHTGEFGSTPSDRAEAGGVDASMIGEIAFLRGRDVQSAFQGYMNSPGHRAVIMTPEMRFIGVAGDQGSWVGLFSGPYVCTVDCGLPVFDPNKPSYTYPTIQPVMTTPPPTPVTSAPTKPGATKPGSTKPSKACAPGFAQRPVVKRRTKAKVRVTYKLTSCTPKSAKVIATVGKKVTKLRARTSTITARSSKIVLRLTVGKKTFAKQTMKVARK